MTDEKLPTVRALRELARQHLGRGHSKLKTKEELLQALRQAVPDLIAKLGDMKDAVLERAHISQKKQVDEALEHARAQATPARRHAEALREAAKVVGKPGGTAAEGTAQPKAATPVASAHLHGAARPAASQPARAATPTAGTQAARSSADAAAAKPASSSQPVQGQPTHAQGKTAAPKSAPNSAVSTTSRVVAPGERAMGSAPTSAQPGVAGKSAPTSAVASMSTKPSAQDASSKSAVTSAAAATSAKPGAPDADRKSTVTSAATAASAQPGIVGKSALTSGSSGARVTAETKAPATSAVAAQGAAGKSAPSAVAATSAQPSAEVAAGKAAPTGAVAATSADLGAAGKSPTTVASATRAQPTPERSDKPQGEATAASAQPARGETRTSAPSEAAKRPVEPSASRPASLDAPVSAHVAPAPRPPIVTESFFRPASPSAAPAASAAEPLIEGFFVARIAGEREARRHRLTEGQAPFGQGRTPHPFEERLGELPAGYAEHEGVLLARDPSTLFFFWDFHPDARLQAAQGLHLPRLLLQIFEGGHFVREEEFPLEAKSVYLHGLVPGRTYRVEALVRGADGRTASLRIASNPVTLPPEAPSGDLSVQMLQVPWGAQLARYGRVLPGAADHLGLEGLAPSGSSLSWRGAPMAPTGELPPHLPLPSGASWRQGADLPTSPRSGSGRG